VLIKREKEGKGGQTEVGRGREAAEDTGGLPPQKERKSRQLESRAASNIEDPQSNAANFPNPVAVYLRPKQKTDGILRNENIFPKRIFHEAKKQLLFTGVTNRKDRAAPLGRKDRRSQKNAASQLGKAKILTQSNTSRKTTKLAGGALSVAKNRKTLASHLIPGSFLAPV